MVISGWGLLCSRCNCPGTHQTRGSIQEQPSIFHGSWCQRWEGRPLLSFPGLFLFIRPSWKPRQIRILKTSFLWKTMSAAKTTSSGLQCKLQLHTEGVWKSERSGSSSFETYPAVIPALIFATTPLQFYVSLPCEAHISSAHFILPSRCSSKLLFSWRHCKTLKRLEKKGNLLWPINMYISFKDSFCTCYFKISS